MKLVPTDPFVKGREYLLAFDPSTKFMGWAIIHLPTKKFHRFGVLPLKGSDPFERMLHFYRSFVAVVGNDPIVKERKILWIAVETQFVGRNPNTAVTVGRSRGWAEFFAAIYDIRNLAELAPKEVKAKFSGWGDSNKQQMIQAVADDEELGVDLTTIPESQRDNAADGVAVAYVVTCELYRALILPQFN